MGSKVVIRVTMKVITHSNRWYMCQILVTFDFSLTGIRTRAFGVRNRDPNQLDYEGRSLNGDAWMQSYV